MRMVGVKLYNGVQWSIHPKLKQNLDILINDVKTSKMDLVIVIDGPEGLGKSFLARGVAMYCATRLDVNFSVEDIQFDLEPYISESLKAAKAGQKHKINLLDEARKVLHRARGGSYANVKFTNYLSECRALGQVHIILAPAFHDLDKYLVMWRMSLLIHCVKNYKQDSKSETGVSLFRGEYKCFVNAAGGKKALNTCWEMKSYTYPHQWEVHAVWPGKEVFRPDQIEAYEKKKFNATVNKYYAEEEERQKAKEQEKKDLEELESTAQQWIKSTVFAKKVGLKPQTIINNIKSGVYKGRQFGRLYFVHISELDGKDATIPENQEMRREQCAAMRERKNLPTQPNINKEGGLRREAPELQKADPPLQ